jgi:hypothetical protein
VGQVGVGDGDRGMSDVSAQPGEDYAVAGSVEVSRLSWQANSEGWDGKFCLHLEWRRGDLEVFDLEELLFSGHGAVGCVVVPVNSGRVTRECVYVAVGQEWELVLARSE